MYIFCCQNFRRSMSNIPERDSIVKIIKSASAENLQSVTPMKCGSLHCKPCTPYMRACNWHSIRFVVWMFPHTCYSRIFVNHARLRRLLLITCYNSRILWWFHETELITIPRYGSPVVFFPHCDKRIANILILKENTCLHYLIVI